MIPLVVGICVAGTYGLFELFVRRKERLTIIEKIGEKLDASAFEGKYRLPGSFPRLSFSALKGGCLLTGIGLGLLLGFVINLNAVDMNVHYSRDNWYHRQVASTVYGASVLIFGGVSLIVAFIIETKMSKKKE
jgi:hypothetical protein